ncbi:alpha/beta hydrolase family domain-containing protein [Cordyceps javanica]|uniref:Alpha/beta hydrolase family domain-containing protein n=1 Tax=Cordyceps javanica TaxID=43265 RepID=A0A545UVZ3_9HYPO|nr:alpha/beta hydrolase family domain-containing protein [Cordyceps javanica]
MSFQVEREYGRHILSPIYAPSPEERNALQPALLKAPTTSPSWTGTVHRFCGTGARAEPEFWPSSRFGESPGNIPDNDKFDTKYRPESGKVTADKDGVYRMYASVSRSTAAQINSVPCPTIVVKRYIPTQQVPPAISGRPGVTLLMLPGMGLVKEVFEPMIEVVLQELCSKKVRVEEIWSVDMPLCGETALANPVGYAYGNEKDITRDLLMFITGYLPVRPQQDLPEELPFRAPDLNGTQLTRSNLHVIAHSLGAQAAMLSAAHAPDIFSSLTVMDPAMIPGGKIVEAFAKLPKELFCMQLEEQHSSREDLVAALQANKRTRGWDARVAAIFADRAVVQASDGSSVRLIAQPRLEWALYYDKETPTHCYDRLTDITTPFNAIMPTKPFAVPPKMFEADVAAMKQPTRITWLPKTTHQVPFERVDQCARLIADWLHDRCNGSSDKAHL